MRTTLAIPITAIVAIVLGAGCATGTSRSLSVSATTGGTAPASPTVPPFPEACASDPNSNACHDAELIFTVRAPEAPDAALNAKRSDADLIKAAHDICAHLDGGRSVADEISSYSTQAGRTFAGSVYFVGAAVSAYCPKHLAEGGFVNPSSPTPSR